MNLPTVEQVKLSLLESLHKRGHSDIPTKPDDSVFDAIEIEFKFPDIEHAYPEYKFEEETRYMEGRVSPCEKFEFNRVAQSASMLHDDIEFELMELYGLPNDDDHEDVYMEFNYIYNEAAIGLVI